MRPVWQRLADRPGVSVHPTTTDADPRLLVDQRTVKPVISDSDRVMFMLPRGASEVRLVSRGQSPNEARPWLSDTRQLGVPVTRLVLRGADEVREVPVDHPDLVDGWCTVERDGQMMSRWTDGEAVLPLSEVRGIAMLEVHLPRFGVDRPHHRLWPAGWGSRLPPLLVHERLSSFLSVAFASGHGGSERHELPVAVRDRVSIHFRR